MALSWRARGGGNLLDLIPQAEVEHELDPATGRVTLLLPRFRSRVGRAIFGRLNRRPLVRTTLDELGSFVWQQIDGSRDLHAIAASAREHFREQVEPAEERVAVFARFLERGGYLRLARPGA